MDRATLDRLKRLLAGLREPAPSGEAERRVLAARSIGGWGRTFGLRMAAGPGRRAEARWQAEPAPA